MRSSCAVELVPSVPKMFGWYYPDADQVLAEPNGRVVIADGRNHLELVADEFDIIVTDPPPPIQSSGVSVISSLEYYETGRDHLTDGPRRGGQSRRQLAAVGARHGHTVTAIACDP